MTDYPLRAALFRQEAIADDTTKVNDALIGLMTGLPEWWNVGAEATERLGGKAAAHSRRRSNRQGRVPSSSKAATETRLNETAPR